MQIAFLSRDRDLTLDWARSGMVGLQLVRQFMIVFVNSPFNIMLNLSVLSHLTTKDFKFKTPLKTESACTILF